MTDYIDRQAAIDATWEEPSYTDPLNILTEVRDRIEALPSAEVEPVKHGRWTPVTNGRGGFECSICHSYAPSYQDGVEWLSRYCPNCGAKMEPISASPENGQEQRRSPDASL